MTAHWRSRRSCQSTSPSRSTTTAGLRAIRASTSGSHTSKLSAMFQCTGREGTTIDEMSDQSVVSLYGTPPQIGARLASHQQAHDSCVNHRYSTRPIARRCPSGRSCLDQHLALRRSGAFPQARGASAGLQMLRALRLQSQSARSSMARSTAAVSPERSTAYVCSSLPAWRTVTDPAGTPPSASA